MSWFYERIERESSLNGKVRATRYLGRWEVTAGGGYQTTDYVTSVWRNAMRRVPRQRHMKVLMLGFGAGGAVKYIRRRFPDCRITAIEWDPVMLELTDRLQLFRPKDRPTILVGDMREVVPSLKEKFDLILCDAFQGPRPAPAVSEAPLLRDVASVLEPGGALIVNVFTLKEVFSEADRVLSRHATWKYRFNWVALYRHFGQGKIGDPLPEGYRHFRSTDAYVLREGSNGSPWHPVGTPGCMGARWKHGPLWFEGYQSDREPVMDPYGPTRFVTWQPFHDLPKPRGWWRSWAQPNAHLTGFAEIRHPSAYWEAWSAHAKRHRRHWLKTLPFELVEITSKEFCEAYQHSTMPLFIKELSLYLVRNKIKRHDGFLWFLGARDRESGKFVAAFAAVDVPESFQSFHLASFVLSSVERTSVGVGMVDAWFKRCIAKGFRFVDFDLFWAPGDPKSWKGFSRFKGQFGITYIKYPKPFIKLVWGKKRPMSS